MESQPKYDIVIVGGGIIGLATAMALTDRSEHLRIAVLEKEDRLASHQSGKNSGVIHSGIYYKPGSAKARLCVQGSRALISFCQQNGIRYETCGKLIVATSQEELPRLEELHRRGVANGVADCTVIGPEKIREMEPHAAGIKALHVPSAGIIDYSEVAHVYAQKIEKRGGLLLTRHQVRQIRRENGRLTVETAQGDFSCRFLINCGGLHSDQIARSSQVRLPLRIIPFRGEYYELIPEKRSLIRGLLYPVPDPRFPFLGVHFTRRIDGRVDAGPNAVLALKREGYRRTDVSLREVAQMCSFPGFWRMAARYWKTGLHETVRSLNKKIFVRDLQRLVPSLQEKDLIPSEAGVRAQAVTQEGTLLDDFHLIQMDRMIHVCNAPSPAATASLAIGEYVAGVAAKQFNLSPRGRSE